MKLITLTSLGTPSRFSFIANTESTMYPIDIVVNADMLSTLTPLRGERQDAARSEVRVDAAVFLCEQSVEEILDRIANAPSDTE